MIKIIIKYILTKCLKSFKCMEGSCKISSLEFKKKCLTNKKMLINIINGLIDKNKIYNCFVHIERVIHKNLEILIDFGKEIYLKNLIDLLDIGNNEKNFLESLFSFYDIENINIYYDIIAEDVQIDNMIFELKNNMIQ